LIPLVALIWACRRTSFLAASCHSSRIFGIPRLPSCCQRLPHRYRGRSVAFSALTCESSQSSFAVSVYAVPKCGSKPFP
jgi:hypothetical protein